MHAPCILEAAYQARHWRLITCAEDDRVRSEALARSADAFVGKPLTVKRTRALLLDHLIRWEPADLPTDLSTYRALLRNHS